ncbi:uncharacterized protein EI97DRAFT_436242 [Westerdykella ornata]|uniref:SUN domain-containing protein n=1 Tax=Westerdykella ornata TaxID=318751 RepID=A0A6A6JA24_WESOR|nr:uncharacterized protein EI97DRAFT_436242 [Westerdykella ornata]KAF2273185.1 hypothetical protein EI97DRAFT_436242 [Westerdykella ornata]
MLTIGAPLRKWTPLLLLCSLAALAQTTDNTTTTVESSSNVSVTSLQTSTKSPSPTRSSPGTPPSTSYESTCAFRTINYIIHTLPQQCAKTTWSPPSPTAEAGVQEPSVAWAGIPWVRDISAENASAIQQGTYAAPNGTTATRIADAAAASPVGSADTEAETETDSLLDSAKFLSFEEWKKKNLARAGQSPETVGQGRAASSEARTRHRPVNVNAMDALGEESEIDIDFSGFVNSDGATSDGPSPAEPVGAADATKSDDEGDKVAPTSFALSKDAGKTCKERFNYASFDCAATVLKTNDKAKSSTAVLVENKDSYMLNECSAQNKFIIVELCDDILVDTVVLANYEFFSSMFRHFRVSVSDRYPVKLDRWRVLGTFEARNSRDIQPFLIKEPQIWARYLRIEFLSHYGSEFYCPISLLRVHGTTMMEQFRREEEQARGDDDFVEPIEVADGDAVKTAVAVVDHETLVPAEQPPIDKERAQAVVPGEKPDSENTTTVGDASSTDVTDGTKAASERAEDHTSSHDSSSAADSGTGQPSNPSMADSGLGNITGSARDSASEKEPNKDTTSSSHFTDETSSSSTGIDNNSVTIPTDQQAGPKTSLNDSNSTPSTTGSSRSTDSTPPNPQPPSQPHQPRASSPTQPSPPAPTTQESFYKSIHKRLQQLEANSTLSLQYIESQSLLLRDAFISIEKRQVAKTEKFLAHLNATVMQELKSYRALYEQLWQSTVLELEGMKERQRRVEEEVGTRLGIVADELVWQKRMALVQSTLLLLFFGVVLFVRSGPLGGAGAAQQQQQGRTERQVGGYGENMYTRLFDISPPRSPREGESYGLLRRRRTFRDMWRGSGGGSQGSDTSPPGLLGAGGRERGHGRGHGSDGAVGVSDVDTEGARSPVVEGFSSPEPGPAELARSPAREDEEEKEVDRVGDGATTTATVKEIGEVDTGLLTPVTSITSSETYRQTPEEPASSSSSSSSRANVRLGEEARLEVLATQSGPATPRGRRDVRASWEVVGEAVERLAEDEKEGGLGGEGN